MVEEALIMGMPVTISIVDSSASTKDTTAVFDYFRKIDEQFSTYKQTSEISAINKGEITSKQYSSEMKKIFSLSEETKSLTDGYFDIFYKNKIDPSGLVKGYAIWEGSKLLLTRGLNNFFIEIAGDIQTHGVNEKTQKWKVGIENPFNRAEIISVVHLGGEGIATSGTYIRGEHIYNPLTLSTNPEIASMSVIASNIYEADRFATAAFAMGLKGIDFIEQYPGLEGLMVTKDKKVIKTSNFFKYEN